MSQETYLTKQLYARRKFLKERRASALETIRGVAERLISDEKLLLNRGVKFNITEKGIYGDIKDTVGSIRDRISLSITEWEALSLDGKELPDGLNTAAVYKAFCDALTLKIPTEQLLKSS